MTLSLLGIQINQRCIWKICVDCFNKVMISTGPEPLDSLKHILEMKLLCLRDSLVGYAESMVVLIVAGPAGKL